ncbi:hypothetical protein V2J09_004807 [Rumex salicifolius]
MASRYEFSDEEMKVDTGLGYPRAYAKLCRDRSLGPYTHGPPFTFTPYPLQPQMVLREKELDEMFPIIDLDARPTAKSRIFLGLLWKQLNHLGNAGFDPAIFRVDPYGNVIYYYADSASPLAWEIDHWFPCSRGGLTVPSNLRILQWQVCKRKHNKLEILVPWWDLQLGISINQFLSIFAASNSDFRHRAFSWLFEEGANEELNESQSVDSHNFPHHFVESKERMGMAPAAVVITRKDPYDAKRPRLSTPIIATSKSNHGIVLKENENPDMVKNPYQAIVMARNSLKQREETLKMKGEIQRLDDEVNEIKQRNEEEKVTIQDLEMELIKRKRRVEKCRRLADSQSSYRAMLEKMIRDALHQSVVYKEQVRLNQAAASALTARLEAQKAICDSAEKQLHQKFKQKEDLEKQIRPEWDNARKRSRMDDSMQEYFKALVPLAATSSPAHKELRLFLEEEQKLSEARLLLENDDDQSKKHEIEEELGDSDGELTAYLAENQFDGNGESKKFNTRLPFVREPEIEEDEETRKEKGKGNVEKWLQMLLTDTQENDQLNTESAKEPHKEIKAVQFSENGDKPRSVSTPKRRSMSGHSVKSGFGLKERTEKSVKEDKGLGRSESARAFRVIPSSPSMILGMKKGVDCIRKKPLVIGDEESEQENIPTNYTRFLRSPFRSTKKAAKI